MDEDPNIIDVVTVKRIGETQRKKPLMEIFVPDEQQATVYQDRDEELVHVSTMVKELLKISGGLFLGIKEDPLGDTRKVIYDVDNEYVFMLTHYNWTTKLEMGGLSTLLYSNSYVNFRPTESKNEVQLYRSRIHSKMQTRINC